MSAPPQSPPLADSRSSVTAAWLLVGGVFVAASLLQVPPPGINEPHYLTKARAFADPDWCERDFFLQSGNAHYVFFAVVGPLTKLMSFTYVAVLGRVLSLLLLACGWNMIGRRLGLKSFSVALSAIMFCGIGATGNFSGEWIIGGFEGKVPAYGFAAIGTAFWMDAWRTGRRRDYACAGAMLGAAVAWHPVVGMWFCVGTALSEFARLGVRRFRRSQPGNVQRTYLRFVIDNAVFASSAVFVALPGLVPAAQLVLASDVDAELVDRANYIQVFWRLAHHLDPSTFALTAWIHTAVLLSVCAVTVSVVIAKSDEAVATQWAPLLMLLAASASITLAGIYIGWHTEPALDLPDWPWRAKLLKFYPFRFFDALLPMSTSLAIACAWSHLPTGFRKFAFPVRSVAATLMVVLSSAAIFYNGQQLHASYTPQAFAEWRQACEWMRDHTPQNALVLGPRESFALKWFAERAEFVSFKDCPQDAAGILEWNRRLWTIHGWSESSYHDQSFDPVDTDRLHEKTGITHIITRRLGPFVRPPVYTHGVWRVYEIGPAPQE